jgi:hypothetical protein
LDRHSRWSRQGNSSANPHSRRRSNGDVDCRCDGGFLNSAAAVRSLVLLGATPSAFEPPAVTDWRSVLLTGAAAGVVIASFVLVVKHAGKAAR